MDMSQHDRDWVFARRFVIRRMIEQGDPSAVDRIPNVPPGVPVGQVRAALTLLSPDEVTPTALRILTALCDQAATWTDEDPRCPASKS